LYEEAEAESCALACMPGDGARCKHTRACVCACMRARVCVCFTHPRTWGCLQSSQRLAERMQALLQALRCLCTRMCTCKRQRTTLPCRRTCSSGTFMLMLPLPLLQRPAMARRMDVFPAPAPAHTDTICAPEGVAHSSA